MEHLFSATGDFLMPDESKAAFAVIRYNLRTYAAGGVMAIVKGRTNAEATKGQFEGGQSSQDHQEGWRYFIEKTDLKPGMDPQEATHARENRQDVRESEGS
jgi:hypothetical protein